MDIPRQDASAKENLGLLAVMEAIEDKSRISQREVARITGLNVKKVNYCLHKLLEKGYVKFQRARTNPDKRVYLYILTPAGIKVKSKLTYDFIRYTFDFYAQVEGKLLTCLDEMVQVGIQRIFLYGLTDVARIVLTLAESHPIDVVAVVDDEPEDTEFHGAGVIRLDDLAQIEGDGVLITHLDEPGEAERRLLGQGLTEAYIWKL